MSKPVLDSDDDSDFEDAVSDIPNTTSSHGQKTSESGVTIEEITEAQSNLSLNNNEDKNKLFENPEKLDNPDDYEPAKDDDEEVNEYIIDEDTLKDLEKYLTPEEIEKNRQKANKMKLEANELFKNDEAEKAIQIYSDALRLCPTTSPNERAVLYGNRAAAKIKIDSKKSAIEDCTRALELWPEYIRVLLRRAKLYEGDNKLESALDDYKKVFELDPSQSDAREACVRLPPLIDEQNEKLKAEMMVKLKDLGNMILKPFGLSTSNFQVQQDPNSGGYSINFNQNSG